MSKKPFNVDKFTLNRVGCYCTYLEASDPSCTISHRIGFFLSHGGYSVKQPLTEGHIYNPAIFSAVDSPILVPCYFSRPIYEVIGR